MEHLVESMQANGALRTPELISAFRDVDRTDFLPQDQIPLAGRDRPLPIGQGQTNSQPSTVAFTLEMLQPQAGDRILDVGSGSGWTTALLAHVVGEAGYVYGVERVDGLVEFGRRNLDAYNFANAEITSAGDSFGLLRKAPFDKILVSASAETIPGELVDQIAPGGRMVISVGNSLMCVEKSATGEIDTREYPGFVFVPLKR
ncbi:L-isoaspartyl protein carboxyl methyltransferase [Candidatus Saccharibacteria bacterium QS_5_54_17]|nr:MAG: L-isoaspartyl protein carboxyl methyltransferase [Candidatus Saccharibacteria bacterium QS_5_54_17]